MRNRQFRKLVVAWPALRGVVRLHRPYIPWSIRETVVLRQIAECGIDVASGEYRIARYHGSAEARVRAYLRILFGGARVELHHRPALCNRRIIDLGRYGLAYDPPANHPDYLIYLLAGAGEEHDVETRVRGQHGQYSDLALARKRRRKERKAKQRKRSWPKRKLRWSSRWTA